MINRVIGLFALLSLVVVLGACAPELDEPDLPENNTQIPGTELLGPSDRFNPNQNAAVVILGIRAGEILGNNAVAALWQQYDPNRERLVGDGTNISVRYSGADQQRDVNRVLYYVFKTRPGYYILQQSATTFRPSSFSVLSSADIIHPSSVVLVRRSNYGVDFYDRLYVPFGRGRSELNRDNLLNDLLSATVSHRFYVNPGDIVYLGNFVLGKTAPWVQSIERDNKAIVELMKSYPQIEGQLVFRDSLVPTNIRCDFGERSKEAQGLQQLRDLVIQNRLTPGTLNQIGCANGVVDVQRDDQNNIEVEPTIDFGSPLSSDGK